MDIPTQRHLLVADIADDIILTKEGGAALILKSSALNFSLLVLYFGSKICKTLSQALASLNPFAILSLSSLSFFLSSLVDS